jgi:two-component system chemotaxis response regulator CheY
MFPLDTTILVVDDMKSMRMAIKSQLKNMGYTIFYEAEDGEKAFNIIKEQKAKGEAIELVLSDWNMPEHSGLELIRNIRDSSEFEDLPFLLITAESEQTQLQEVIDAGISDYLKKPFGAPVLQEKILAVWKKHNS